MTLKEIEFVDKVEKLAQESGIELRDWREVACGPDVFKGWNAINFREDH